MVPSPDAPTQPNPRVHAPPASLADTRPHRTVRLRPESWWGAIAVVVSLAGLAACVALAVAQNALARRPTLTDRYSLTVPGQASVYRVTSQGQPSGFLTINVVPASNDAVVYANVYGSGGTAHEVHNQYTNYNGTGQPEARLDFFERVGDDLRLVAQTVGRTTYTFDPPALDWSPRLLAASLAEPEVSEFVVNDFPLTYRMWREADEPYTLPGGHKVTAVVSAIEAESEGELLLRATSRFVAGLGQVAYDETGPGGEPVTGLALLNSSRLAELYPEAAADAAAAMPLAELVAGGPAEPAFFREGPNRPGAWPGVHLPGAGLAVAARLKLPAAVGASPLVAGGHAFVAVTGGR
jgi:hypothetical protein